MPNAETATFTCGHSRPVPTNYFGRGAARVRRMTAYYDRPCAPCAVAALTAHRATLTGGMIQGVFVPGTTPEADAAAVAKRLATYHPDDRT